MCQLLPSRDGKAITHGGDLEVKHAFLSATGEMADLVEKFAWESTDLGPIDTWPEVLKLSMGLCLNSRFPLILWWGPNLTLLYNDAYCLHLAGKHPWALGRPGSEVWSEIWDVIGPMLEGVMSTGRPTWNDDLLLYLNRQNFPEETYHTFSYSAIRDVDGKIVGIFTPVTETTERILGSRRMRTLSMLSGETRSTRASEVLRSSLRVFADNPSDVPYVLFYKIDQKHHTANLIEALNIDHDIYQKISRINLTEDQSDLAKALLKVSSHSTELAILEPDNIHRPESKPVRNTAITLSVLAASDGLEHIVMVGGVSPHLLFDGNYEEFYRGAVREIGNSLSEARAYQQANEKAEALAALDRAKTVFFNNVSHEFRTPLTLMLGPLQTLMETRMNEAETRAEIEVAHRNGLRLLRLVNTLLDFSRIEAGRVDAVYEPTELSSLTLDLASSFRSLMEKGGLEFDVHCIKLDGPVYIDRDMWEKVVLNLLSNAFKYTLAGKVTLRLLTHETFARLIVTDTGCGITESDLEHLFERFHRSKDAKARTHEGTGIGLSLVQQLVKLHGGTISVQSTPDKGTTFTVDIPFGKDHLPSEKIGGSRTLHSTALGSASFTEEAQRWLSGGASFIAQEYEPLLEEVEPSVGSHSQLVLIADDNSDMRDYLSRLLNPRWRVIAVADGMSAFHAAIEHKPDLILSDVMMPGIDGLQLISKLRENPETRTTPVILLSARAGEDARVEGLQAGADDYLTKPFAARELIAHVDTNLKLSAARRELTSQLETLVAERTEGLREANRKLEIARDEALEMSELKTQFMSNVSHEIRTPMAGILGFTELLFSSDELSDSDRDLAESALSAGQRLMLIVNELLDFAKLEARKATLDQTEIHVAKIMSEVFSNISASARIKNLTTELIVDDKIPACLYADAARLSQILTNLANNAVKFTHEGRIVLSAMFEDETDDEVHVRFKVKDDGIGISDKAKQRLFEPFMQADGSTTRKYGGTGLGLSIVKKTVDLMKGTVGFDSELNKGSDFWFVVPLRKSPEANTD
jgi:signal transduction histidine kinase